MKLLVGIKESMTPNISFMSTQDLTTLQIAGQLSLKQKDIRLNLSRSNLDSTHISVTSMNDLSICYTFAISIDEVTG